jgi:hypothetical protein
MIYYIKCDWHEGPKEETIGIMDMREGAFYFFMFCLFSCVFVELMSNLWALVCVLHGMPTPISRTKFYFQDSFLLRRWGWCEEIGNALVGGQG